MFRVAICDNEDLICSYIEQVIWEDSKKTKEKIDIDIFCSGERLLKEMESGTVYDLIFLDIELDEESGVQVGLKIREVLKNEIVQIVYISGNDSYAMKLFDVRPLHFLIKPIEEDKIIQIVRKAREFSSKMGNVFIYKQSRKTMKKQMKDIIYFESMDRQIRMVTVDGDEIFYSTLKEVAEQVKNYNFITCHKSYLINYRHVAEFQYEELLMSNGEGIPISQPQRKYVREYQMKYERSIL